MRTAFIGHRKFSCKNVKERLVEAIRLEIENGCDSFIVGSHGQFDSLVLDVCRKLRQEGAKIEILVVITSLHKI